MEFEAYSGASPYDIYFPQERLVVEINGSTHFYDLSSDLLPKFKVKQRLFEKAGITYIDLDYH